MAGIRYLAHAIIITMQARRLMRSKLATVAMSQYWLGPLEVNYVHSPNGANLAYWNIDANLAAQYNAASDSLVLTRPTANGLNLYVKPYVTAAKTRYQLLPGQTVVAGAQLTTSHACRVQIDIALYDTPTAWNWVAGTTVETVMAAGQTLPLPIYHTTPTALPAYYVEYTIGFLGPLNAAGTMPTALPAGATLTLRDTGFFVDQLPADGLFSATSPAGAWQGTANASPSVRRVATPKTHFAPPSPTVTIAGTTYHTAQAATPPAAFTPTSVWNRPASTLTPIADSDARLRWLVGNLGTQNNRFAMSGSAMLMNWGVPTYYADSTSPSYTVICKNSYGWNPAHATWSGIRIPIGARAANNSDGELTVYDIERNVVWWFWQASFDGTNWSAEAASHAYLDGNGVAAGMTNGDPRNTENGQNGKNGHICHIRWNELAAGRINRVVRFALPNSWGSTQCVWPIYYSDGQSTNPLAIPQGAILRLKPSINIDVTFAGVPPVGKLLLHQMQDYGIMFVDSGGDEPSFILEDTYFENGLARWPAYFDPLAGVKIADSGAADAAVYFDACYPQP